MARFDYKAYYQEMKDLERLQVPKDEILWIERFTPPDRAYEYLLYLGCNILRTTHLAREVVAVMEHLDVDYLPVAGPQFCCGYVQRGRGDVKMGDRMGENSLTRFQAYQPKQVIMWCPSCNLQFEDVLLQDRPYPFDITHVTAFLADRINQLPWKQEIRSRVVLHSHVGKRQVVDTAATIKILQAIPGVEVLGTVESDELSYHCAGDIIAGIGQERFTELRRELCAEAERMGADTLVTMYHSCHREWCEVATDRLAITNYISLVAHALGCGHPDLYQQFKAMRKPEVIVQQTEETWQSHSLSREEATKIAETHFAPNDQLC